MNSIYKESIQNKGDTILFVEKHGLIAQLARAPAWHAGGRGFESR